MTFRDNPPAVERVLAAARRIDPAHSLYVTFAPAAEEPPWEFHPFKRWLALRTDTPDAVVEAVACTLLARSGWLGQGAVTAVPNHLQDRFRSVRNALRGGVDAGALP